MPSINATSAWVRFATFPKLPLLASKLFVTFLPGRTTLPAGKVTPGPNSREKVDYCVFFYSCTVYFTVEGEKSLWNSVAELSIGNWVSKKPGGTLSTNFSCTFDSSHVCHNDTCQSALPFPKLIIFTWSWTLESACNANGGISSV